MVYGVWGMEKKEKEMNCPQACGGGACCRRLIFHYPNTDSHKEWAEARGMKISQISKTHVEMVLHHPCSKLLPSGKCKIHDNKPHACKIYPQLTGAEDMGIDLKKSLPKNCYYRGIE